MGVVIVIFLIIITYVLWQEWQVWQGDEGQPTQQETAEIKNLRLEIDGLKKEHGLLLEQREELIERLDAVRHQGQQLQAQLR